MPEGIVTNRTEERISSRDGRQLHMVSWLPEAAPRGVVVVVHGFNSHSAYYPWVAEQLIATGLAVYTFDLRGRGRSDGERYFIESFQEYQDDVDAVVSLARSRTPGLPIYLLGHSAGGVISSIYALDHQAELAGLICESFAFRVFAPDIALTVLKGLSHVVPHTHVLRLNIDDFSRDPAVIAAMKADPEVRDEVQPTLTVAEMVRADERLEREFATFHLPVLILHGSADKVTRPDGSRQFHASAGSADKTLKIYDGHAHDLLNDVGKETVIADITNWIQSRLPTQTA
ncbi:MAG TPA: lysophospholipase [Luteitalea sp.]|nr:lysophospholipase [Luteitalea sp.]